MTSEDIRRNARFKIVFWGFLGVLCTVIAAPYIIASRTMNFVNLEMEVVDDKLESGSLRECVSTYFYLSVLAFLYCVAAPMTLTFMIPGYFFDIGAQEILLGYRDDEGADMSFIKRAFFELETGTKYLSINQVTMVREKQEMQIEGLHSQDVDTKVSVDEVSEVCVDDKKKRGNDLETSI